MSRTVRYKIGKFYGPGLLPVCLPSGYLMSQYVTKSSKSSWSPSIFEYCKQSKAGGNILGVRLVLDWYVLAWRSSHEQYWCYLVSVVGPVPRLIVREWALRFPLGTALCVYPLSTWQSNALGMRMIKNFADCYYYSLKGKQKWVTVIREMKLQHRVPLSWLYNNLEIQLYVLFILIWLSQWQQCTPHRMTTVATYV